MLARALIALLISAALPACGQASDGTPVAKGPVRLVTVVENLDYPWGMAFLPDGRLLVTERPGRLRLVSRDGRLSPPLSGVPEVDATGQGGLLDVAIDPQFASNSLVYVSFSEKRDSGNGTSVARGRLTADGLAGVQVIFRQQPAMKGGHHFGSRLVFGRDGRLFVTLGERNIGRTQAQDLGSDLGKVVRIESDGKIPADNPFVGKAGARPEIWSYGHRNVQGAALDPVTGELWTNEHGPKGGDELNLTRAGENYGWPLVSYGTEYSGAKISERGEAPGITAPVHYWVPSIAASGLLFYTGDKFPEWRGSAFVGGLKTQMLVRLELDGTRVVREERLLENTVNQRVRDVEQGPDGCIYLLTDAVDGRLLRMEPAT
jgi:glucose/arabinose dehydrogenase